MPFDNNSKEVIVATEIMEDVMSVEMTLAECKRILKKEGQIFILTPLENEINTAGQWFDYDEAVRILKKRKLRIKKFVTRYATLQ
jgi:2-polyprenyl-3-methyl-5-hydroxy-6-metoxy-1,4-benzoquinol methylase